MVQKANPQPAPGNPAYPGYDAGQSYGAGTPVTVPGQGTTAVGDPTTANMSVTKTGTKYDNLVVPGSAPRTDTASNPTTGIAGSVSFGAPKTLGEMKANLYDLGTSDTNALADLQVQLIKAGLLDPSAHNFALGSVSPDDPTDKAYTRLLTEAIIKQGDYDIILNSLGEKSPRGAAYFDKFQKIQAYQAQQAAGGGTERSTTFSFTDPNKAREVVKTALENRLGRDPKTEEISQFISTLHATEASTPTHGTATYGGNGIPKSSISTSSTIDPAAAADAFATSTQARANEAGTQSEIGFMGVLQRLLGVNAQGG